MAKISRRQFIKRAEIAAGAAIFCGIQAGRKSISKSSNANIKHNDADKEPNIIFIMTDDLGYNHLSCYGQKKIQTPNIDNLAKQGMRFTQMYAGCTVCAPSRSVLLTGRHMGHATIHGNTGGIPLKDSDITIGEVLKKAGYKTAVFGKWGVGDQYTSGVPYQQGFDEAFGYLHQIHAHYYYPEYLWDNEEKFEIPENKGGSKKVHTHELFMKRTQSFLNQNATSEQPFFLYLPWTLPHVPLETPDYILNQYAGRFGGTKDKPNSKEKFAAMIGYIDKSVGKLLEQIKSLGLEDNTLIIFTSDNGGQSGHGCNEEFFNANAPLRGYKRDMYEGGIRVPMIARFPGVIPEGTVCSHPGYFPDIMPTLAEFARAEKHLPSEIDGISFAPSLVGEGRQKKHKAMYWEMRKYYWENNRYDPNGLIQAVRMGKWKAVRTSDNSPLELYDLSKDIGETNNIADKKTEIIAEINKWIKENRDDMPAQPEPEKPEGKRYR